jgi:hypothetical protein
MDVADVIEIVAHVADDVAVVRSSSSGG